jgi:hypothetical protein
MPKSVSASNSMDGRLLDFLILLITASPPLFHPSYGL